MSSGNTRPSLSSPSQSISSRHKDCGLTRAACHLSIQAVVKVNGWPLIAITVLRVAMEPGQSHLYLKK